MSLVKIVSGPIVKITEAPVVVNLGKSGVQGPAGNDLTPLSSSTTVTMATGAITFNVANTGAFGNGTYVSAVPVGHAGSSYFLRGYITATTSTSVTMYVDSRGPTGTYTFSDWTISIEGPTGAKGATGDSGVAVATAPLTYNSGTKTVALTTNTANGVPVLDSSGLLLTSQLPALSISNTSVVASQAEMLALTAETGDIAVRTDASKSYILTASPASTLANWQELLTPPDTVTSVQSRTGNVTITATDLSLGNADNTSDLNKPVSTAAQTALNLKSDATHTHVATGDVTGTLGASSAALTIASGAVTSAKILDGTIATADLANLAVTDAKQSITTASGQTIGTTMPTGGFAANKAKDTWADSFAHARTSECSTMPRILANASLTMVSGTIYAVRCVYTGNQPSHQFTGMRWYFAAITSTVFTQLRGAVYDSTGALIANGYTADYSGSATASALSTPALTSTITLTPGAVYYIGVTAVFTGTAPTIRGTTVSTAMAGITGNLTSRSATGYTTGTPGSVANATANHPWLELT